MLCHTEAACTTSASKAVVHDINFTSLFVPGITCGVIASLKSSETVKNLLLPILSCSVMTCRGRPSSGPNLPQISSYYFTHSNFSEDATVTSGGGVACFGHIITNQ